MHSARWSGLLCQQILGALQRCAFLRRLCSRVKGEQIWQHIIVLDHPLFIREQGTCTELDGSSSSSAGQPATALERREEYQEIKLVTLHHRSLLPSHQVNA